MLIAVGRKLGLLHEDRPEDYQYYYALDFLLPQVMNILQPVGVKTGRNEVADIHAFSTNSGYHMQEILKRVLPKFHGRENE
jgi:hypothetical protein